MPSLIINLSGFIRRHWVPMAVATLLSFSALADEAGDIEWRHLVQRGSVTLKLNPLGSTQRQAFYVARGFTAEQIAPYARSCGFSIGFLNNSPQELHTDLRTWYVMDRAGQKTSLRLPDAWDAEWARHQIASAQRIAFRWAQFQRENTFEPGDWIMGMATLERSVSGPFQLVAPYRLGQEIQEITIDGIRCEVTE